MSKRTRGVILDVDGTLVDSNELHARAWVDAIKEFGRDADLGRVGRLIGMGGDKVLPELTGLRDDSAEGERLSKRRSEIFKARYLPRVRAFPKSRALLERMRDAGLALAVATSAKKDELGALLDIAGVRDLLEGEATSSDAERSKPDPDIVQAALAELGLDPSEVVMLGDTPYDVDAARTAGVRAVALRCGGWGDVDLEGAIAVYDDPSDLLSQFESSPFVS